MTKTTKTLPAFLGVEFKNQTGEHTGTILEDRGICWKIRDDEGEEYQVKKASVTRQFDAAELEEDDLPAPAGTLSASLAGLLNADPAPAPAAKATPAAKVIDPDLVTLGQLCTECGIIGRIARRRLRKAFGVIGIGERWEWKKGSADLDKVRSLLKSAEPVAADPAPAADAEAAE